MAALLKELYNLEYITTLSDALHIDAEAFQAKVFDREWNQRELKQRMRHIATVLYSFLPSDYSQAISILKNAFSKLKHSYALQNMIFQDFVEVYGLNDFEISMDALKEFTKGSSSEFAIRQFILKYPQATMAQMQIWAKSDNHHVRRLASEGCRPRLPWAIALHQFKENPHEILLILEMLKDDSSSYVRKSVANNINDISKDNPLIVKELTKSWIGRDKNRDALLKHGCRTLLKSSDREILNLFGFNEPDRVQLENFQISPSVKMGEELAFSFSLNSEKSLGKIRVEYAIDFLRQNEKYNSKVFKISEGVFNQNEKFISKKYSFKPITTRVYYKGHHKLSIIINGVKFTQKTFQLV